MWLDLSCVHVYRLQTTTAVQQAARVAAGPRRTAEPAGQQRPASQPVSVFCNFLFLLLPHFFCIYVCVCPALDPDFTAISRASGLVPLRWHSSKRLKQLLSESIDVKIGELYSSVKQ